MKPRIQLPLLGKSKAFIHGYMGFVLHSDQGIVEENQQLLLNITFSCLFVKLWNCMSGNEQPEKNIYNRLTVKLTAVWNVIKSIWYECMVVGSKDCRRYLSNNNPSYIILFLLYCCDHFSGFMALWRTRRFALLSPRLWKALSSHRGELQSLDSRQGLKFFLYRKPFSYF